MAWSKVNRKTKKPLGWWFHKIMCELHYSCHGSRKGYYHHLNKMVNNYGFNLYGNPLDGLTVYGQAVEIINRINSEGCLEMLKKHIESKLNRCDDTFPKK